MSVDLKITNPKTGLSKTVNADIGDDQMDKDVGRVTVIPG